MQQYFIIKCFFVTQLLIKLKKSSNDYQDYFPLDYTEVLTGKSWKWHKNKNKTYINLLQKMLEI